MRVFSPLFTHSIAITKQLYLCNFYLDLHNDTESNKFRRRNKQQQMREKNKTANTSKLTQCRTDEQNK